MTTESAEKSRHRTHTCGQLTVADIGSNVQLAGWVHRKRDHGNLLFIDLRDNYGLTQCVFQPESKAFEGAAAARNEAVLSIVGRVVARSEATINPSLPTGRIEVAVDELSVLSTADPLPFQVNGTQEQIPEEQRLRYRFLDLRREKLHRDVLLRSRIISSLRRRLIDRGFTEFQTPILTSTSPEGARDFLVPSRLHPGKFYALPQAPQQFKQLLMVAGFDRYFQVAPCFRDEDARADRSPGEFYQLDVEMSFVTQDEVFETIEPVLADTYREFTSWEVPDPPFPRIPYDTAMLEFGSDKPDLRNPIRIADVTEAFRKSQLSVFADAIERGSVVRAVPVPGGVKKPRSFFDKIVEFGKKLGLPGVGYVLFDEALRGTLAKFITDSMREQLVQASHVSVGDALLFVCLPKDKVARPAGELRTYLGKELGLIEQNVFRFCWIVDFPFFELDEETKQVAFSHNPFSMPQGGLEALNSRDPLTIKAYQYDIVCNGVELSSGAIRNHRPDIMLRAFEIAGYPKETVEERFGGMLNAFRYGAPPHGGLAPGVDRMVMQIANEINIREVIAFPMSQNAEDLMMSAPSPATEKQLRELHLQIVPPRKP